jgi:hypothetical protein
LRQSVSSFDSDKKTKCVGRLSNPPVLCRSSVKLWLTDVAREIHGTCDSNMPTATRRGIACGASIAIQGIELASPGGNLLILLETRAVEETR